MNKNLFNSNSQIPMIESKLPNIGTTIFTVMSGLATKSNAINLGQGFPDFGCDPELINKVEESMKAGHNQYPPMIGIPELRNEIAEKIKNLYKYSYNPDTEITITAGGTQGIFTIIIACVRPGDEVIVIEPAYDSYAPSIKLAGGIVTPVQMQISKSEDSTEKSYQIPWIALKNAISDKTRLIIINTPHNPTGMIWSKDDLEKFADLIDGTNILVCSDEVYEHMVYDKNDHQSFSSHPKLVNRSFVVSSFGKTFHVTGWKIGYVAAPADLMKEFRKTHQFNVFTVNTPMQYGIAAYLKNPETYLALPKFYQKKRDFFREGLQKTNFKLLPTPGTYFQCVNYSNLSVPEAKLNETEFCKWLTKEIGVAAIPLSAFYQEHIESGIVRFCFAKQQETLEKAIDRLKRL